MKTTISKARGCSFAPRSFSSQATLPSRVISSILLPSLLMPLPIVFGRLQDEASLLGSGGASVSGHAFFDSKDDRTKDPEDSGSRGVRGLSVSLRLCDDGRSVEEAKTDDTGHYSFGDLDAGEYCIDVFAVSDQYAFADAWKGSEETAAGGAPQLEPVNAIDPNTGSSACFELEEGENMTISIGLKLWAADSLVAPGPSQGFTETALEAVGMGLGMSEPSSDPSARSGGLRGPMKTDRFATTVGRTDELENVGARSNAPKHRTEDDLHRKMEGLFDARATTRPSSSADQSISPSGPGQYGQSGQPSTLASNAPSLFPSASPSDGPAPRPSFSPTQSRKSTNGPTAYPTLAGSLHGPTRTERIVMTIVGIDELDDANAWSDATEHYITDHFNENKLGAYDVRAEITVTGQEKSTGTLKVMYDQVSVWRSADAKRDHIFVATSPFGTREGSVAYIKHLKQLSPYYDNVVAIGSLKVGSPARLPLSKKPVKRDEGENTMYVIYGVGGVCTAIFMCVLAVIALRWRKRRKMMARERNVAEGADEDDGHSGPEQRVLDNGVEGVQLSLRHPTEEEFTGKKGASTSRHRRSSGGEDDQLINVTARKSTRSTRGSSRRQCPDSEDDESTESLYHKEKSVRRDRKNKSTRSSSRRRCSDSDDESVDSWSRQKSVRRVRRNKSTRSSPRRWCSDSDDDFITKKSFHRSYPCRPRSDSEDKFDDLIKRKKASHGSSLYNCTETTYSSSRSSGSEDMSAGGRATRGKYRRPPERRTSDGSTGEDEFGNKRSQNRVVNEVVFDVPVAMRSAIGSSHGGSSRSRNTYQRTSCGLDRRIELPAPSLPVGGYFGPRSTMSRSWRPPATARVSHSAAALSHAQSLGSNADFLVTEFCGHRSQPGQPFMQDIEKSSQARDQMRDGGATDDADVRGGSAKGASVLLEGRIRDPARLIEATREMSSSSNPFLADEDNEGGGMSGDEVVVHVAAPAGTLGITLDRRPEGGPPYVWDVKDSCPMGEWVKPGDRVVAVDSKDVRGMSAVGVSTLLARKSRNPTRQITLLRMITTEDDDCSVGLGAC